MKQPWDILLTTINAKWIHPSLALRLLKANLGNHEERAKILEFTLRQSLEEKTRAIIAAAPRILAVSVSIWNHKATLELLRGLNYQGTEPQVILGGPEVSFLPKDAELFRYAHWVIRGEGESAFRELCEALLGEEPAALPLKKFIDAKPVDLSAIKTGYQLYHDEDLRTKLTYLEASRGCPFGCEFCLSSVEQRVRYVPLEPFLDDVACLISRGARAFKFLDRSFNLDMARARRIIEFFLEFFREFFLNKQEAEKISPKSPYVHFEMVPAIFPSELRELLTRFPAGTLRLELGIQTFNPKTAALIGRPSDPDKELEALEFLRTNTRAIVHADLIAGLPGEDLSSFAAGFDRLWQVRPTEIQLGILKCLPGTAIVRHDEAFGMRYAAEPPYEVLETAALPAHELDRIKNFARFWELIVNRGAFTGILSSLVPEGEPVFERFMALSDRLLALFGRNWGIDREALRDALRTSAGSNSEDQGAGV
jgi:radical SAM superfamily enzyme YgiQ (UPF0313 family)